MAIVNNYLKLWNLSWVTIGTVAAVTKLYQMKTTESLQMLKRSQNNSIHPMVQLRIFLSICIVCWTIYVWWMLWISIIYIKVLLIYNHTWMSECPVLISMKYLCMTYSKRLNVLRVVNHWAMMHDDLIKWKHFLRYGAICAENSSVTGEFSAQRPVTRSFYFFICAWLKGSVSNHEAGDLRRHRPHYGVTVMGIQTEFFKLTDANFASRLCTLFNKCISTRVSAQAWKWLTCLQFSKSLVNYVRTIID